MPTDVTGLEPDTPVKITSTSATERGAFRRCRRQWFLTVVHRLDRQEGSVHLFLGKTYHSALEAYYRTLKDGGSVDDAEIASLDGYQEAFDTNLSEVEQQLGFLAKFGLPAFREMGELGLEMLQNYLERERTDPLLDEVIAVEFRVNVAIRSPRGRRIGILSVQADAVGVKDGELCVVDHKTASRVMPSAHLDLDDQLSAEVFSWWIATGDFPEKVIYNVSYKRVPKPPELLKSGKLSRAKGQLTTGRMYRDAIAENGLPMADYVDFLAELDAREQTDENRLFRREATFRTPGQMAAFDRDVYEEWRDMREVARHPERAYPNPTSENCGRCSVRVVCTTMQDAGDVEAVIRGGFVVADPRR